MRGVLRGSKSERRLHFSLYVCMFRPRRGRVSCQEGANRLLLDPSGRGSPGRAQPTRPGFQHGNDGDDGAFPAGFVGRP